MKNLITLSCLFLYLLIPFTSSFAVVPPATKATDATQQINCEELAPNKLTLKEKILLKRLTKKSKKNRSISSGDDGFAVASMVVGILSLLTGAGIFLAIPAIILAAIAFKRMRRNGEYKNRGMAIAGMIMGILVCVLTVGFIGLLIFAL